MALFASRIAGAVALGAFITLACSACGSIPASGAGDVPASTQSPRESIWTPFAGDRLQSSVVDWVDPGSGTISVLVSSSSNCPSRPGSIDVVDSTTIDIQIVREFDQPCLTDGIVAPYSAQLPEGLDPAAPIKVLINDIEATELPAR